MIFPRSVRVEKHVPTHEDVMAAIAVCEFLIQYATKENVDMATVKAADIFNAWHATLDLREDA